MSPLMCSVLLWCCVLFSFTHFWNLEASNVPDGIMLTKCNIQKQHTSLVNRVVVVIWKWACCLMLFRTNRDKLFLTFYKHLCIFSMVPGSVWCRQHCTNDFSCQQFWHSHKFSSNKLHIIGLLTGTPVLYTGTFGHSFVWYQCWIINNNSHIITSRKTDMSKVSKIISFVK